MKSVNVKVVGSVFLLDCRKIKLYVVRLKMFESKMLMLSYWMFVKVLLKRKYVLMIVNSGFVLCIMG